MLLLDCSALMLLAQCTSANRPSATGAADTELLSSTHGRPSTSPHHPSNPADQRPPERLVLEVVAAAQHEDERLLEGARRPLRAPRWRL